LPGFVSVSGYLKLRRHVAGLRSRKLVTVGDSLAVTLPPDWLRWNRLEAGDMVELTYNGEVQVRPLKRAARRGLGIAATVTEPDAGDTRLAGAPAP
jgi:antitoxin component of MazEF toxin-antitoxin module